MQRYVPEATGVDDEFAFRSARYLARHGMDADQICEALCHELDLTESDADTVVDRLAA